MATSKFVPAQCIAPLLIILFFLLSTQNSFAATFSISPSSGNLKQNCASNIDIALDATGQSTNAADIIIDYDPTKFEIVDSDPNQAGTQIRPGNVYTNYFGNTVDAQNGVIRLTGASFSSFFSSFGVFATIQLKPLLDSGTASLSVRFTGSDQYNSLDSNIADSVTSNDLLSAVTNGTFTFSTGSCVNDTTPPVITNVSPTNLQSNVPSDADIEVNISDTSSGIDIRTVQIIINGVTYNSSNSHVDVTGNSSLYNFVVHPIDPLSTTQANTVLTRATDLSGNSSQKSISFNIPAGPVSTPATTTPTPTSCSTGACPTCPATSVITPTGLPGQNQVEAGPDLTSPQVEFIKPKNSSDTISLTPDVIVKLSDSNSGINLSTLKVSLNDTTLTSKDPDLSVTGGPSSYIITAKFTKSLDTNTNYYINVYVADNSGNGITKSIYIKTEYPLINRVVNLVRQINTVYSYPDSKHLPTYLIPFALLVVVLLFLLYLISLLKKLNQKDTIPLGMVYNSLTLEPLSGIRVDIYSDVQHRATSVTTNVFGIFSTKLPPGKYIYKINNCDYAFPSTNIPNQTQIFSISQTSTIFLNIPIDPYKNKSISYQIHQFLLPRPGIVTNSSHTPLSGVKLTLVDPDTKAIITSRISDSNGHYRFLLPHGHYQMVEAKSHQELLTLDTRHLIGGYTAINRRIII